MVSSMTKIAPNARANAHTPNDALQADAGAFATDVARVFARPHTPYFEADAARRRLIQILATRVTPSPQVTEAFARWSARRLTEAFMPDAPLGFVEALRKSEGSGWDPADYRRLQTLLAEGGAAAKLLRHAVRIDPTLLRILEIMPPPMCRPRIVSLLEKTELAQLFAQGVRRVLQLRQNDASAPHRLAERLERSRTTIALFRALIAEIGLEVLAPPPVPGADWLVPLASEAKIRDAARRFENCLVGRIGWLLCGHGAYYEVVGDEAAIVEIVRDKFGMWLVGEIRGHANKPISPALFGKVLAHLQRHGAVTKRARVNNLAVELAVAAGMAV
jgi:hypothetical protein